MSSASASLPPQLSWNPLWSVVWQQLHCAASQKPINQLTSAFSLSLHMHKHTLVTDVTGKHWVLEESSHFVHTISDENINNSLSAHSVKGKLQTHMDWHNFIEQWCQVDWLPVYSSACLAYIYPITLRCTGRLWLRCWSRSISGWIGGLKCPWASWERAESQKCCALLSGWK